MKWIFVINKNSYFDVRDKDELKWNSAKGVKEGELILVYTGKPYGSIEFIFSSKTDPFEDKQIKDTYGTPAIYVHNKISIPKPITFSEMNNSHILSGSHAIKMKMMGSHFKVNEQEWEELKNLIIEKNPELKRPIEHLEGTGEDTCFNENHRGRAHITRDVCYLLHQNPIISEGDLINVLINKVGDDESYWKAYFQNCIPKNCVKYNLDSARSLGLLDCNQLKLTDLGLELINNLEENEVFTYHYSSETKRFFYKLAQEDESINTAMDIIKNEGRMRFWSPICDRTKRVIWEYHQEDENFICDEKKYPECPNCDHEVLNHVDQTSLVLETLKKTGKHSGFVFWFTSRVTPMHLTGKEPQYQGQHILWDQHEEDVILGSKGKITEFLNYISRNYVRARENKERVKGHKLSLLFNKKFPQYLANLSNSLLNDDQHYYKSGSGYHARGRFIRHPWVLLWDENKFCYTLYIFEEDMSGFYLSLNIPWGYANQVFEENTDWNKDKRETYLKSCASSFRGKLEGDVGIPEEFKDGVVNSPWWNTTILGKYYSFKNLPPENELEEDLKKILILSNSIETEIPRSFQIIQKLFKEYKDSFLETEGGVDHSNKYDLERQKVHHYFEIIQSDAGVNQIEDPPINHLLPIKEPAIAPVAVGDIKAYGYKAEDLPGLTIVVRDLIQKLNETNDKEVQKSLISEFKNGQYKKGFQTAMLTPTLYYINPDFWFINRKTVSTFNLFSELIGDNQKITSNLEEYIDNNEKVHDLVDKIREFIPELDFETFDEFCHWMCDKKLGNYAMDTDKFNDWLLKNFPPNGIKDCLKYLLINYQNAKSGSLDSSDTQNVVNILSKKLPEILTNTTNNKYQTYSSAWDKWHYSPYVALMSPQISDSPNEGFFVNYIFREDMSGLYLSLRQGVSDINQGDNYLMELSSQSDAYRELLKEVETDLFDDALDLKRIKGNYLPFYEAANIFSKFYPADNLPTDDLLLSDLSEMINLYNSLIKNIQFDSFNDYLNHKNFLYSSETIENFLLSLKVKPLVILTGNSGTGKTKIAQLFGDYLKTKNEGNYLIIPVGANWTENRHLLGFYNVIIQDYQTTAALEFLLKASKDPLKPYFLILDEMNLSHVERYFADFLSAMESGEFIPLHSHVDLKEPLLVPNHIKIPENVFVVGTVNVDETTYMFSPKVLDRANTIEFPTYPAKNYILGHNEDNNFDGNLEFLENPLIDLKIRSAKVEELNKKLKNVMIPGDNLWTHLAKEIHQFQEILGEAGFDFGFRVIDEILRFIYVSWVYEGSSTEFNNWNRYFDAQIMQKMLPKVHGSQRELDLVLEKLFKKCYRGEYNSTWHEISIDKNDLIYPYSAEKLQKMGKTLQEKRFVSFTD